MITTRMNCADTTIHYQVFGIIDIRMNQHEDTARERWMELSPLVY